MRPILTWIFVASWFGCLAWGQAAGGVPAAGPQFRVVRSLSGSRGSVQQGRYIVEDPRTTFYVPADKQVIVYFEWEGPPGKHHFEGYWKNPEGKIVVISDFAYEADQRRFGGYWTLDLTEAVTPGMWSVEARVDGEVTGIHAFQIVAAPKPAEAAQGRHMLTPSETYQRMMAATVTLEKYNDSGQHLGSGTGFFISKDAVLTAFQNIDGAAKVIAVLPNSHRVDTDEVLGWSRWQDWAVLKVSTTEAPPTLDRAKEKTWAVGDRCFSIQNQMGSDRVLVDTNISGMHVFPEAGERMNLSSDAAPGAPVLNEYGEVIGVAGGSLYPGMSANLSWRSALRQPSMATPIAVVATSGGAEVAKLHDLAGRGEFVPQVTTDDDLLYGFISDKVEDIRSLRFPANASSKAELSRAAGHMSVLLVYNPRTKRSLTLSLGLYDLNNKMIGTAPAKQLKFTPGQLIGSTWNFDLTKLKAGIYRVDALENQQAVWRDYIRITE